MKISRKETNVKECLGILIMSLAATVDSDNWESIFLVAFMIIFFTFRFTAVILDEKFGIFRKLKKR